ncbi:MAG: DNA mismatch repair endonuclease MutL [Eubacteriaceae bacterium]|jgi:DNA mismatch repair protein MutL
MTEQTDQKQPGSGRIKMLSPATVDKIAAGEVILRPVSVVKELCENSLDAGADRISIEVEKGGKRLIRITDNGIGIRYNEVPLAFQRHATSKISFPGDLDALTTLGFRGEALSSVAAVAEVELVTRFRDEEIGSRTVYSGGELLNHAVAAFDRGTEITVSDLFANVPVRSKYMKKDEEEEAQIRHSAEHLALSHPETAFTYISGGRRIFQTPGNGDLHAAAAAIFGRSTADHLRPFRADNEPMKLYGLIGDLELRRSHRNLQIFFVNGRCVNSRVLTRAYEEAWEGLLMKHQYPAGIICLDLPPRMLDVNIHPQKTEIRILNETLAVLLFRQGIRSALRGLNLIANAASPSPEDDSASRKAESAGIPGEPAGEQNAADSGSPEKQEAGQNQGEQTALPFAQPLDLDALLSDPELDAPWMGKYFPDRVTEESGGYAEADGSGNQAGQPAHAAVEPVNHGDTAEPVNHEDTAEPVNHEDTAGPVIHGEAAEPGDVTGSSGPVGSADTELADSSFGETAAALQNEESVSHQPQQTDRTEADVYQRILSSVPAPVRRMERPDFTRLRLIGQLFNTYLLLEDDQVLFLIDQHAAHEAMLYEAFRKIFSARSGFPSQAMLIPRQIGVSLQEAENFNKYASEIRTFGFDAEMFGEDRIAVRAVPVILGEVQDARMILPVIELFASGGDTEQGLGRIITMSCKAAVKGGQKLSRTEIEHLLGALMELDNPYTCPHGRPVIMKLREYELRKLFKRIV